jgi:predicted dehydrogenase
MRKAVLVGCGGISGAWMRSISQFDDVEMVGLVDLKDDAVKNIQEKYDLKPKAVGDDITEVIRKSGADLVFDCTVPEAHRGVTLAALAEGCDIMGEKPMASSLPEAREMVEAAQKSGKIYAVMQNRRYLPGITAFRETVESGVLGTITEIHADFYIGAHFSGFRVQMDNPLLLDMAIHTFDQARFISGKDPLTVYAVDWNPSGSWYKNGASAAAIYEMTDNTVFTYRGSWCAEGMNTPWESTWRVQGEKGAVLWDGRTGIKGEITVSDEGFMRKTEPVAPVPIKMDQPAGHFGAIRDFLDALKDGNTPQTICTDNIKSVAMVYGAIRSRKEKAMVML